MQRISMTILLTAALACSGGGGGSDAEVGLDSDIAGDGVTQGPITGFGSRVAGGTAWTIPGATIVMDGQQGGFLEADLLQGMVVTIEGTRSTDAYTGSATRVEYDDAIEGPVELIEILGINSRRLRIMKQDVLLTRDATLFENLTGNGAIDFRFDTVLPGDVVEVSGQVDDDGEIVATLVSLLDEDAWTSGVTEIERKGTITQVNQIAENVVLGTGDDAFAIEYDDSGVDTDLIGLPANRASWVGEYIEVKGILLNHDLVDATACGANQLCEIAVVMDPLPASVENVDIEGFVTSVSSQTSFDVDGRAVDASAATFDPSGSSFISQGALVAVEGDLVAGEIVASLVRRRAGSVRYVNTVAQLADVDASARTVVLGPWTVHTDRSTVLIDSDGPNSAFDLGDIDAGDQLVVLGFDLGGNNLRATHLTRNVP